MRKTPFPVKPPRKLQNEEYEIDVVSVEMSISYELYGKSIDSVLFIEPTVEKSEMLVISADKLLSD